MCSAREPARKGAGRPTSYSAMSDYIKCPKYFELKRELELPEDSSWWGVGGSAVHAATEEMDRAVFARVGG